MFEIFQSGRESFELRIPDEAAVYRSEYPRPPAEAGALVQAAVRSPIGTTSLGAALARRGAGNVVVVVSDITRPIPYAAFLPGLLSEIEAAGVHRGEILILVAAGMHRPSRPDERTEMFGSAVASGYRIEDHKAEDESGLAEIPGLSASNAAIRLNRHFVKAGFRIVTGLVEPHFMAGFSGGRKSVCPGLSSLETIQSFHGYEFLADPRSRNANLAGNPLHEEALSIARQAKVDFSLNVVLDKARRVVAAFAGGLEPAHDAACEFVRRAACRTVEHPADVVVTSSGGHPLDTTFYQCVKGFVSCLPAVREGGTVIAFGSCAEGVGSPEYAGLLRTYSRRWSEFLSDIRQPGVFTKDQWELQMQDRALERVGRDNLHFVTDGLDPAALAILGLSAHAAPRGGVGPVIQDLIDRLASKEASVAVFPEGPYCVPLA